MTTFTKEQQSQARKSFIEKSRENAWGAACHADFLAKTMEGLFAEHQKLIDEDTQLETEIKALDNTTDYHTVENRTKRQRMQEVRQQISKQMEVAKTAVQRAMQQMQELLQTAEFNLKLAKHAETWEWKEADNKTEVAKSTSWNPFYSKPSAAYFGTIVWLALAAILIAAFIIGVGVALLGGMDTGRSHAFFDKFEARKPTEDENEWYSKRQERRNELAKEMQILARSVQEGHRAMQGPLQSVDNDLALAKYAETWEWKDWGDGEFD